MHELVAAMQRARARGSEHRDQNAETVTSVPSASGTRTASPFDSGVGPVGGRDRPLLVEHCGSHRLSLLISSFGICRRALPTQRKQG